jgi:FkbM family methyltransferase
MLSEPWGALRPNLPAKLCIAALRLRNRKKVRRLLLPVMERLGPNYDVQFDGLKFRCRVNDNWTETRIIIDGGARIAGLGKIIDKLNRGDVFVDIGANCGLFTARAARAVGTQGSVLAVEPNPTMVDRLKSNIRLNSLENVRVAATAVGDAEGRAIMYLSSANHGQSGLRMLTPHSMTIDVPVAPLLAILRAHGVSTVTALKIDIEGFEDRALMPFFRHAPKGLWPRHILLETKHSYRWDQDCVDYLLLHGYTNTWRDREDILLTLS